jgi:hypothetical protein
MTKSTKSDTLFDDVLTSIEAVMGGNEVASEPNTATLYWRVGQRVCEDIEENANSKRSRQVIDSLSKKLQSEGRTTFSTKLILETVKFSKRFPDYKSVIAMSNQVSWNHFQQLLDIDDDMKRDFYAWMCLVKQWSTKSLQSKISGALYEKTPSKELPGEEDDVTSELNNPGSKILSYLGLKNL